MIKLSLRFTIKLISTLKAELILTFLLIHILTLIQIYFPTHTFTHKDNHLMRTVFDGMYN